MLRPRHAPILAVLALAACSCGKTTAPNAPAARGWIVYTVTDSSLIPPPPTLWAANLDGSRAHSLGLAGICPSIRPHAPSFNYSRHDSLFLGDTTGHESYIGPLGGAFAPWSPNGQQLLAGGPHPGVFDPQGHLLYAVAIGVQTFGSDSVYPGHLIQWLDDSHFLYDGHRALGAWPNGLFLNGYYRMDARTGQLAAQIVEVDTLRGAYLYPVPELGMSPTLSPDGRKLLGDGTAKVLNIDTGVRTTFAPGYEVWQRRWGADSRTIFFLGRLPGGDWHIYRTSLDSPNTATQITAQRMYPRWDGFDVCLE